MDRGSEEKASERSRWFRRRDKQRNSFDYGIKRRNSSKNIETTIEKEKFTDVPSQDQRKRSSSDQTAAQERLKVPSGVTVRRLSSPEIDAPEVITASLSFQVPNHQKGKPIVPKEPSEIPYIEDMATTDGNRSRRKEVPANSRQRTGSSDSFLGQPITGTMSFQPLCKKTTDKQSHDSVLSSSSADLLSPSARNTPISDILSGTSTPLSGAPSPPPVLSPDSGTPGLSPPPSPPPSLNRRTRRLEQHTARTIPLSHSGSSHTFGPKSSLFQRPSRDNLQAYNSTTNPLTRSRTADTLTDKEEGASAKNSSGGTTAEGAKKYTRRRHTRERAGTTSSQQQSQGAEQTTTAPQVWKRWEIIASDQGDAETFL